MASYQSITIVGNVGGEPEKRMTQGGKAVANFNVAVNEKRGGEDHTEWFRCVAWEKTADVAAQYVHKGDQVMIVGRLQTRKWTDDKGQERSAVEVVVDRLVLLGGRRDSQSDGAAATRPAAGRQTVPNGNAWGQPAGGGAPPTDSGWGDPVPF